MATTQEKINIVIDAEDKAQKAISSVNAKLDRLNKKVQAMKPAFSSMAKIGGAAFIAIGAGIAVAVKAAAAAEKVTEQLTQGLFNVAWAAEQAKDSFVDNAETVARLTEETEKNVKMLAEQASALQELTKFSDDEIRSAQAMLSTFALTAEEIAVITPRLLDMATGLEKAGGQMADLQNIAIAMGKAITMGASALTRYGVVLSDAQIEAFDTAKGMEKMAILAEILDGNFAGLAEAVGRTFEGRLAQLKNSFADLAEVLGKMVLPTLTAVINKVQPALKRFTEWAENNPKLVATITKVALAVTGIIAVLGLMGLAVAGVTSSLAFFAATPAALIFVGIAGAVAALAAGIIILRDNWETLSTLIEERTGLITAFQELWETLVSVWTEQVLPSIQRIWEALQPLAPIFKAIGIAIGGALLVTLKLAIGVIEAAAIILGTLFEVGAKISSWLVGVLTPAFQGVVDVVTWLIDQIKSLIEWLGRLNVAKGLANVVKTVGGAVGNLFGRASGGAVQSGRSFLVGERGPEVFTPGQNGRINPGVGGATIVLQVSNNNFFGAEDVDEFFTDTLMRKLKENIKL